MALTTTGIFADYTATMAYYLAIGNMDAFMVEKAKQQASKWLSKRLSRTPSLEADIVSTHRAPKRAATQKASTAQAELGPRKQQRRE
jgi:hypothetical protein